MQEFHPLHYTATYDKGNFSFIQNGKPLILDDVADIRDHIDMIVHSTQSSEVLQKMLFGVMVHHPSVKPTTATEDHATFDLVIEDVEAMLNSITSIFTQDIEEDDFDDDTEIV